MQHISDSHDSQQVHVSAASRPQSPYVPGEARSLNQSAAQHGSFVNAASISFEGGLHHKQQGLNDRGVFGDRCNI